MVQEEGGQTPENEGARGSTQTVRPLEAAGGTRRSTLWMEQALWRQLTTGARPGARCLSKMRSAIVKRGLAEITFLRTRDDTSTLRYSSDQEGGKLI